MRQEYGRDLVARDAAREQVLVQERDRVDQQVVAVVAEREAGTGFVGGKPGSPAEHLDAHLGKPAGHVIGVQRVGRQYLDIVIQVDLDIAAFDVIQAGDGFDPG